MILHIHTRIFLFYKIVIVSQSKRSKLAVFVKLDNFDRKNGVPLGIKKIKKLCNRIKQQYIYTYIYI